MQNSQQLAVSQIIKYEKLSQGLVQRSTEWLEVRNALVNGKKRIGGSEIASLLGENPYCSVDKFLKMKSGEIERDSVGIECDFGTIMENVAMKIFEHTHSTKIYCENISVVDTMIEGLMYSPDGIIAMPYDHSTTSLIYDTDDITEHSTYIPVLIEIKCPFNRTPKEDMPSHYIPQVQCGIMTIPIVNIGLFIDNLIRICSATSFNLSSEYNRSIHKYGGYIENEPIYYGTILIHNVSNIILPYCEKVADMYDFGSMNYDNLSIIMRYMTENKLSYNFSDISTEPVLPDTDKPYGVICWKYFGSFYTQIDPNPHMISKINSYVYNYFNNTPIVKAKQIKQKCIKIQEVASATSISIRGTR